MTLAGTSPSPFEEGGRVARTPDPPEVADVVVIGAGHNGLVCAGYLAAAGLEVVVLEARPLIGGSTVTEELTLPGFAHDSCSSAHVLIQSNPLLADDELGLLANHGLEYVLTDPAVVLPQPDGDALVMHRDVEATAAEIARWSSPDARQFELMMAEWGAGLARVHGRWSSGLPLGDDDDAGRYAALRAETAWDVVHSRFTNPAVRSMMLWLAMATIQDPRRPGTGVLPSSIASGRVRFGWATPLGGSGALPRALERQIASHGGRVVCDAAVESVDVAHGRVSSVTLTDGRRISARRAVISSAHVLHLASMLRGTVIPEDLRTARDSWRPGLSVFAVHAALRAPLSFGRNQPVAAAAAGLGSVAGIAAQLDGFASGRPDARDPWLLVVNQSSVDSSRAPDGAATLKLLTVAPYERADGQSWADTKDEFADRLLAGVARRSVGLDPSDLLAVRAESPVDIATLNQHNVGGSCHGGEFVTSSGAVIPGWPQHRLSIDGLFLTGSTSHPGGSVSGRPGRNAARTVLQELRIDPATVMGPS
jgi:phytoene dehydrogenase-like protein